MDSTSTMHGTTPRVGDNAYGGIVVGQVQPPDIAGWLLIAAPSALDTSGLPWQNTQKLAPALTRSDWDGLAASLAMMDSKIEFPATAYCMNLDRPADDCSPWYLPSRHELWLMTLVLRGGNDALMTGEWYWSSTEHDAAYAWDQGVGGSNAGFQSHGIKTYTGIRVRPVRRIVL